MRELDNQEVENWSNDLPCGQAVGATQDEVREVLSCGESEDTRAEREVLVTTRTVSEFWMPVLIDMYLVLSSFDVWLETKACVATDMAELPPSISRPTKML